MKSERKKSVEKSVSIQQKKIIDGSNQFLSVTNLSSSGVTLNKDGICGILVPSYLIHKSKGKEGEFFSRISKMVSLQKENYQNAEFAADFCQEIEFGYDPSKYKKDVTQGDINKIYNSVNKKDFIFPTFALGLRYTRQQVEDLFQSVIPEHEMVYLAANNHAVGVYKKYNKYYLYDPNSETGEFASSNVKEFTDEVLRCLFVKKNENYLDFEMRDFKYFPRKDRFAISKLHRYPSRAFFADQISTDVDPNYNYSLHASCAVDDDSMVVELLKRGANPFFATEPFSALDTACIRGYKKIVRLILLHRGNDLSEENAKNALFIALRQGHQEIAEMLFDHIEQKLVHIFDGGAKQAFIYACQGGNVNLIRKITKLFEIDESMLPEALLTAAKLGRSKAVSLLLRLYPQLTFHKDTITKSICAAIENGHYNIFTLLQNRNYDTQKVLVETIASGQVRMTGDMLPSVYSISINHVLIAIVNNQLQILKMLLQDESKFDETYRSTLLLVKETLNGSETSCQRLLTWLQRNTAHHDSDLLLMAAINQDEVLFNMLYKLNIHIPATNDYAFQRLVRACDEGNFNVVKLLVQAGVNSNQLITENDHVKLKGLTPLLVSADHYPHVTLWLLENAPEPSLEETKTLMRYACQSGYLDIIARLVSQGFDCNQVINKSSPLEFALRFSKPEVIKFLLDHGADPTLLAKHGTDFVLSLCRKGYLNLVRQIIDAYPDLKEALSIDIAKNVLQAAKSGGQKGIEALLYIHKPSQEAMDKALFIACSSGNANAANTLLQHGAIFGETDYTACLYQAYQIKDAVQPQNDAQLLHLSLLYGHTAVTELVFNQNKYLHDLETKAKTSPLHLHIKSLRRNGNILPSSLFQSPDIALRDACMMGNLQAVQYWIDKKNFDFRHAKFDPLVVAASYGHKSIVSFILSHLKLNEIEDKLLSTNNKRMYTVVASILEAMAPNDLSKEMKNALRPFRGDIHEAYYNTVLYDPIRTSSGFVPRVDAKERNQAVNEDKNALGVFIHITVKADEKKHPLRKRNSGH